MASEELIPTIGVVRAVTDFSCKFCPVWIVKGSFSSLAEDAVVALERTGCGCVSGSAGRRLLQLCERVEEGQGRCSARPGTAGPDSDGGLGPLLCIK